jgi:hypothetical protein
MTTLWLEGINKGMTNSDTIIASSPALQHINEAQEKIGWNQLLKGRIAKQWIQYQKAAMGDTESKRKNAMTWATEMISTIFEYWLKLWKLRNEDRHGRDRKTQREAERKQAIRELEQMYEEHDNITQEAWIVQTPLEVQKEKSTYTIRALISNYSPVLKGSHQTQLETG